MENNFKPDEGFVECFFDFELDLDEKKEETHGKPCNTSNGNKPVYSKKELQCLLANLPDDIQADRNFVTWIEVKKDNGKCGKIPASINDGKPFLSGTNAHLNPELWTDLSTLLDKGHHRAWYWTTKSNERVMIDIDDCVTWHDGKTIVIPEAVTVLEKFDSYSELSPSLQGIRIIVNGETPLDKGYRGVKKEVDGKQVGFEIIAYERGATLTGNVLDGYDKPVKNNQDAIDWFCRRYLSKYIRENQETNENRNSDQRTVDGHRGKHNKDKLFDDINSSLSFRDFIARHRGVIVRNSGENTNQLICPKCNNRSSSKNKQDSALTVYDDNLFCFRCQKSWNIWSYLKDFDGMAGMQRVQTLCDYAGIDLNQYSQEDIKKTEAIVESIPYYRMLAKEFYDYQPFHFDKSNIYWKWNKHKLIWKIVDKIDLLNAFEEHSPEKDTTISDVKNRLLIEIEKIGRRNIPTEPPKTWVQFNGTIIDFNDPGKKIEPDPSYYMTNVIPWHVNFESDIEYLNLSDRATILEKSDTPYTDKVLIDWVGVKYLKTLYEIIAFCLIRDYPLNRIICLIGEGSNGKSCFIRLLEMILGIDNYTSSDLYRLSNSNFETAKLHNKLMCTINEIDHSVFKQTALLKRLTGLDQINMEIKYKNPFVAVNYAKLIIATNTLPPTTDKSYGFYRRWLIIDFPNQFEEGKDPVLGIPEHEIPILCGKAVKLIPELLGRGAFTNEGNIEQRKAKYQMKSSSLREFINEHCDRIVGEYITCRDFIDFYRKFCEANNYVMKSRQTVGKEMVENGYPSKQKKTEGSNTRIYEGLRWKDGIYDGEL